MTRWGRQATPTLHRRAAAARWPAQLPPLRSPVVRRVLALVAAVGLVVAAVVVRNRLDDEDDDQATVGPSTTAPASGPVICDPSLQQACAALGANVVIEPAGTTIDRLSAPDAGPRPAAWVTLAPLPEIVNENRQRALAGPMFATTVPVATTPLVLVARSDRGEALTAACGGDPTWSCLAAKGPASWADLGGQGAWGRLKVGHDDPAPTARGAVVFAGAATGIAGGPGFDVNDPQLREALNRLEDAVPSVAFRGASALQVMVIQTGSLDIVGTTQAEADPVVSPRAGQFAIYPDPVVRAQAVVAVTAGDGAAVAGVVGPALVGAGWQPDTAADTGLPPAGVVQALRTDVWDEVR